MGRITPGAVPAASAVDTTARNAAAAAQATADAAAVASTTTAALAAKAPLASPTFTGTVTVPAPSNGTDPATKTYVDNADNLKAPLASPTFTGHVTVPAPTSGPDAVTKTYADALIDAATIPKRDAHLALVGAVGKASDSGHAHPTKLWVPGDNNLLGASCDPQYIPGGNTLSGGVIQLIWVPLGEGGTLANLFYGVQTIGSGLTSAQCWIGAYTSDGTTATLITNAVDQTTNFGSTGAKTVAVTVRAGQSLVIPSGGGIYIALLSNATTTQVSIWSQGTQGQAVNIGLAAGAFRSCQSGTTQTTLPNTITLSGTTSTRPYFAAAA